VAFNPDDFGRPSSLEEVADDGILDGLSLGLAWARAGVVDPGDGTSGVRVDEAALAKPPEGFRNGGVLGFLPLGRWLRWPPCRPRRLKLPSIAFIAKA
jgi:hypothetical protein